MPAAHGGPAVAGAQSPSDGLAIEGAAPERAEGAEPELAGTETEDANPFNEYPSNPSADYPDANIIGNPCFELATGNPSFELAPTKEKEVDSDGAMNFRLLCLLCFVGAIEGADGVLLPCTFLSLQQDLGLKLQNLALLSIVQAMAGNMAAPLWGVLADRGAMRRKTIVVVGCILQGIITMVLAGVDFLWPIIILRALNGAMLASLRPIANGIVADVTSERNRGKVYGMMGIAMNMGTMGGSAVATNLARKEVMGMQGWRSVFLVVGAASVLVGVLTGWAMQEPRRRSAAQAKGSGIWAIKAELAQLLAYFQKPTFCVLVLQGCFGSIPWSALSFKIMFFQLAGLSDAQASIVDISFSLTASLGALLGGFIGDRLARWSPYHGRPLTAQVSVLAGLPVAWLLFMHRAPEGCAFLYYLVLFTFLGLTATWCGGGVNLPILAEIVNDDRRATIMAWENSLESSSSAIFGPGMVAFLAGVFGYQNLSASAASPASGAGDVEALGKALTFVSVLPWLVCFLCYTLLHWSYKRDVAGDKQQEEANWLQAAKCRKEIKEFTAPGTEAPSMV